MSDFKKIGNDVVHMPKNYIKEITEIYCFLSFDSDGEGLVASSMNIPEGRMLMPLVASDKAKLPSLKTLARSVAKKTGKKIKLVKFVSREELEVIE